MLGELPCIIAIPKSKMVVSVKMKKKNVILHSNVMLEPKDGTLKLTDRQCLKCFSFTWNKHRPAVSRVHSALYYTSNTTLYARTRGLRGYYTIMGWTRTR